MSQEMERWHCRKCSFRVWRYVLKNERHVQWISFVHAIITQKGVDFSCTGQLERTGEKSLGPVDEVRPPWRCGGFGTPKPETMEARV